MKTMKKEQGFTLIELLIVVAIIAVIAAIAVPNLLNARMAANETSAIAALRAIGSAQVAYSSVAGEFTSYTALAATGQIDDRFRSGGTISGYEFGVNTGGSRPSAINSAAAFVSGESAYQATPVTLGSTGRYDYIMWTDFVVRYLSSAPQGFSAGQPVGGKSGN